MERRRREIIKIFKYIFFFIFLAFFVLFLPYGRFVDVSILGESKYIFSSEFKSFVEDELHKGFYNNNIFNFRKNLHESLSKEYFLLKDIDFDFYFLSSLLDISFKDRENYAVVCKNKCFESDYNFEIFKESISNEGRIIIYPVNLEVGVLPYKVFNEKTTSFLNELIIFLGTLNGETEYIKELNREDARNHFAIGYEGFEILISPKDSVYKQTRSIYIALNHILRENEYIGIDTVDVRFEDSINILRK